METELSDCYPRPKWCGGKSDAWGFGVFVGNTAFGFVIDITVGPFQFGRLVS